MARAGVASLLLVVIVFMAGCSGGKTEEIPPEGTLEPIPDAGSISGTVVDETLSPLPNAQVAILDLDRATTTDANGAFAFTNLAPGTYQVAAIALGYTSSAKSVDVSANEDLPVQFTLTQISSTFVEPYVELLGPYSWYFDCRLGNAAATGACVPLGAANPNDKAAQNFTMTEDVVDFVGEMRWQQGSFATSRNLRMSFSYEGRPNTHWWCTATSASPLQWHYNLPAGLDDAGSGCQNDPYCGIGSSQGLNADSGKHKVPTVDHTLVVYTNTPFSCPNAGAPTDVSDPTRVVELALQQRLEVVITLFHGEPKPETYTGFPDA